MNYHHPYTGATALPDGPIQGVDRIEWRKSIEAQLEAMLDRQFELITMLDMMDADPDFEPYLSGFPREGGDDREGSTDDTECDGLVDSEPSLGSVESHPGSWNTDALSHRPRERSGFTRYDQTHHQLGWSAGGTSDLENNCEDEGEEVNEDGGDVLDDPHDWDELEDNLGSSALMLKDGTIVNDREGSECGFNFIDDHGVADSGGLAEQFGTVQ